MKQIFVLVLVVSTLFLASQTAYAQQKITVSITINNTTTIISGGASVKTIPGPIMDSRPIIYYVYPESSEYRHTENVVDHGKRTKSNTAARVLGGILVTGASHVGAEYMGERIRNPGLRILAVGGILYGGHKIVERLDH